MVPAFDYKVFMKAGQQVYLLINTIKRIFLEHYT